MMLQCHNEGEIALHRVSVYTESLPQGICNPIIQVIFTHVKQLYVNTKGLLMYLPQMEYMRRVIFFK